MNKPRFPYKTRYGQFADDGMSYLIRRPDVPTPWVNVMSTGTYGVVFSQTGAGYSWLNDSQAGALTPPNQGQSNDDSGRFIYIRDEKSGDFWSVGWQPVRYKPQQYECMHGVGYSIITSRHKDIHCHWLVFVPHEEPLEIWRLRIKNTGKTPRALTLWTYVPWHKAATEPSHREDNGKILLTRAAGRRVGDKPSEEHFVWHATQAPVKASAVSRRAFVGAYRSLESPGAVKEGRYGVSSSLADPIASLCLPVSLKPGEERTLLFTVGAASSRAEALVKARKFQDFSQVDHAWGRTEMFWENILSAFPVKTPDKGLNARLNTWLRYQSYWTGAGNRAVGAARPGTARLSAVRGLLYLKPDLFWREIKQASVDGKSEGGGIWFLWALCRYWLETGKWTQIFEKKGGKSIYQRASAAADALARRAGEKRGLLALEELAAGAETLFDWADLVERGVQRDHLPRAEKPRAARARAGARKFSAALKKSSAAARPALRRAWEMIADPAARGGNFWKNVEKELGAGALSAADAALCVRAACRGGQAKVLPHLLELLFAADGHEPFAVPDVLGANGTTPRWTPGPAAMLHEVLMESLLGLRPRADGLQVRPCLPPEWNEASVSRPFQGAVYNIRIRRDRSLPAGVQRVFCDRKPISGDILPMFPDKIHDVAIAVGPAK